ncbi:MAG: hypothetical protein KGI00_03325, partial [Candidatus Micrarchaeota archaeon]|nr:hypothetical protein [Candidatus Micrarchaeota archaeon]
MQLRDGRRPKPHKSQSAIEYVSIYGWVLLGLAIFIFIAYMVVSTNSTPLQSTCYITPGLTCMQTLVVTNSMGSKAIVLFQNNLGINMQMASNSFVFSDPLSSNIYVGACFPANVPPGGTVTCTASLTNYQQQPTGTQINPKFSINYLLCDPSCGPSVYNTSGSATIYTSSGNFLLVTLKTSPSSGKISIDGVSYANGTSLYFIQNQTYYLYAVPPAGYGFSGWTVTNGLSVGSQSQSTTATTSTLGTLTASFNFISSSITSSSVTTTSTSSSTTSTSTSTSTTSPTTSTTSTVATTASTTASTATTTSTVLNDCSGGAPNRVSCSQGLGCGYDGCPAYQGGVATWTCQGYGNVQ